MKEIKQIFKEFMVLNYIGKKVTYSPEFKDIDLGNYRLLRKNYTYEIIYLTNGTTITIPKDLIDIFNSLNTLEGSKFFYKLDINKISGNIEQLIYNFLLLIYAINSGKTDKILDIVVKICELGTKNFRAWCKEEFDIELEPIKLNSMDNYLLI